MSIKLFKPLRGCRVYASTKHPNITPGELVGHVLSVDNNIVHFHNVTLNPPQEDTLIWRFESENKLNEFYDFGS